MKQNIKLIISYDGTHYFGWQKAKEGASIEGCLERVLMQILQEEIALQATSRTDAGVHAEGQVANFFTAKPNLDLKQLKKSVNALLPPDIRIESLTRAPDTFHPTTNAHKKEYHYFISTAPIQLPFKQRFEWHIPTSLDQTLMEEAASYFIGTRDFSALATTHSSPTHDFICTLDRVEVIKQNTQFQIIVEGNRFLYKMVRNLVGTLVDVGAGKLSLKDAKTILEKKERRFAGVAAPAHGLILKKITFC